jgi:hypothetical protein
MPELETKLRAAAPRTTRVPADLEDRIWATLSSDTMGEAPPAATSFTRPELIIGEAPPARRSSRLGLALGLLAATAVLLGAVLLAGLRQDAGHPAGGKVPAPTTSTPAPSTAAGTYYIDDTCPEPSRGACFDPFPAGRYSFHKAFPQVTLAVPAGWRNDEAWPNMTVLSRPDTPGATLQILNDAHVARVHGCDVTTVAGVRSATYLVTTVLLHHEGLVASGSTPARIGERPGYQVDLNAPSDLKGAACGTDFGGAVLLTADAPTNQPSWLLALRPGESARIVLANGSYGRTLALVAQVRGGQAELRAWLRKAQPVIDSITFAPCTHFHTFYQPCEDLPGTTP